LGLIGSFSHPPNLEAFRFCCSRILPLLEKNQIKFKFYLAGENNPELIKNVVNQFLKDPTQIINLGFVKDVKYFYQAIDLLIAPLFAGSGTRIKILESLSFGRPVLTTKIGAEGIKINNPFLQIIPSREERNANVWLQMIQVLATSKLSKNDQDNLSQELSKLTWSSLMKKSLSLL
jgi:glycosyltransferase involved in cell wall biosynthesis